MASTYVNDLRLEEIADGEQSGTWGATTNTNLELIGESLGFGTEAITTNADTHTSTIADGATDPVRAMFVKYTGTLDSSCTITIAPNILNRMHFIENGTSGGQNIIISQGSGANVTIPPGDTKAVYLDGAGSGAAVVDAFASLNVVDLKVEDDLTVTDDLIVNGDIDLEGSIDVNGTANLDVVDIDGAVDMASTLGVTGKITADAGIDIDNINIDGTTIALSSGDLTLDVAGDIILDADGKDYLFKDAGTLIATMSSDNTDFTIRSEVSDRDLKFEGNDGGANVTALILDMSDAGSATFSHNVKLPDNGVLALGAGSDLSLSSNGTNGTIAAPNGDLTIDVAGDITLDADGAQIRLKDGGTQFGLFGNENSDFAIQSSILDKDILFQGNDNNAGITALKLDMSDGGTAIFNHDVKATGNFDLPNANTFLLGAGHNVIQVDANTTYFYGGTNGVQFRTADNAAENITFSNTGAAVFNEQGNNADFRVETDTQTHAIFVEGDTHKIFFRKSGADDTVEGTTIFNRLNQTTNADVPLLLNRGTNDGTLVLLRQNNTTEGEIVVSGSTVSYNGGHISRYSQLADGSRDNTIVKGTVMTNLDQMAEWKHEDVLWTEDDKLPVYTEDDTIPDGKSVGDAKVSVGDVRTPAYTEDNEQLNCMAVSSVEGDANVAGVLVNWDNDDKEHTGDMNIAMTGDMVIRIGKDTTVSRGDLLMSAGDGTAKTQGDDIVRSKTIAKVTSTNVSHTYDDGTYLVPCVLMAC